MIFQLHVFSGVDFVVVVVVAGGVALTAAIFCQVTVLTSTISWSI